MDDPHAMPPPDEAAQQSTRESPQDHGQTGSWWSRWQRGAAYAAVVIVAVVLIAGGVDWWLNSRNYVSTTDAQVDGYITRLAPQISGRVTTLLFTDYQHVTAGQPLLKIDPRDYQVKLQQAEANEASAAAQVKQARAQLLMQQAGLSQDQANLQAAQAELTQSQQDYQRDKALRPGAIARQTLDHATAAQRSAKAKYTAAQQAIDAAHAQVKTGEARIQQAQAAVQQANASVAAARLQLSYTSIDAPVAGTIAHRSVAVGDYVSPGQALFAIVQDKVWVTANFKETDLPSIKVGDPVNIHVDAVPSVTFHGKVQNIQPGTGSIFSVLPAENATGNYVKIVQRVPVRIAFDGTRAQNHRLLPGESVEPSIRVH